MGRAHPQSILNGNTDAQMTCFSYLIHDRVTRLYSRPFLATTHSCSRVPFLPFGNLQELRARFGGQHSAAEENSVYFLFCFPSFLCGCFTINFRGRNINFLFLILNFFLLPLLFSICFRQNICPVLTCSVIIAPNQWHHIFIATSLFFALSVAPLLSRQISIRYIYMYSITNCCWVHFLGPSQFNEK